jgi:hypothetical protein
MALLVQAYNKIIDGREYYDPNGAMLSGPMEPWVKKDAQDVFRLLDLS